MFRKCLIFVVPVIVLFSCKKDRYDSPLPEPETPTVLLKDIVIPNLPSPYYHFEYDAAGRASFVSFASELTRYNVIYSGARITEMKNNILVNKDRLQYTYDNVGRVSNVTY